MQHYWHLSFMRHLQKANDHQALVAYKNRVCWACGSETCRVVNRVMSNNVINGSADS